jgi:hypothetical protein
MPNKKQESIQKAVATRKRQRGRGGTQVTKELLEAAFDLYCDRKSYSQISEALNIAKPTISKYVHKLEWPKRREERWSQIEKKTDEAVANEEALRRSRHLKIAQAMQGKAIEKLKTMKSSEISVTECRTMLVEGVKLERELFGESTAEIQIAVIFPQELRDV